MFNPQIGQRVRVTKANAFALEGDEGVVIEKRGWNFDSGQRRGRYVHVWLATRGGEPYRRNISIISTLLEPVD